MPEFTRGEWEDIGHSVSVRRVFRDAQLYAIDYTHPGEKCANRSEGDFVPVGTDAFTVELHWRLEAEHPLTLSPSLLCRSCGHHGFIREGKWIPA